MRAEPKETASCGHEGSWPNPKHRFQQIGTALVVTQESSLLGDLTLSSCQWMPHTSILLFLHLKGCYLCLPTNSEIWGEFYWAEWLVRKIVSGASYKSRVSRTLRRIWNSEGSVLLVGLYLPLNNNDAWIWKLDLVYANTRKIILP